MKPIFHPGNAFLHFEDKHVSKISAVWKALHISIYVALAVVAFATSMAAGNLFQTFNYHCILYCTDIQFEVEVVQVELQAPAESNGTIADLFESSTVEILPNNDTKALNTSKGEVPNRTQRASIDLSKTVFASNYWCNFVLTTALITFIFSTFCVVLLAMCSKGGKGRENTLNRPQNMVYPILVSSIILLILNSVASIVVKNGMERFCASFQDFTNEESCSALIDQFTIHERQRNFYWPYVILAHTFNIAVLLITGQLVLTLLRVIYAVDYQLYALEVAVDGNEEQDFEIEDGQLVKEQHL